MSDIFSNIPFDRSEFACKCGCGFDTVDAELLELAVVIREFENAPVEIGSGCRCPSHNADEGGMMGSKHLVGRAGDFYVTTPQATYDYLCSRYPNKYGFGIYDWGVHADSRADKARWDRRTR